MERVLFIAAIILVFYITLPGIGAFVVRSRWRSFRRRMVDASMRPTAGYVQLRSTDTTTGYLGVFRCFGTLEAIQADDTLWISDGRVSFAVHMSDEHVYFLAPGLFHNGATREMISDEMPTMLPWAKVGSLPEGTRLFVCGPLYSGDTKAVFRSDSATDLTVVIYDGKQETVLERSIWSGRQRNEYWNQLTPVSLAAGSLSLLILASVYIGSPWLRSAAVLAVAGSLTPVLPLIPPGVPLFFLYRRWWQQARYLRAERDLMRLPLRYSPGNEGLLPDGEVYVRTWVSEQECAGLIARGAEQRSASIVGENSGERLCFGVSDGEGGLMRPSDPLAEFLLIPGDPDQIAHRCERRARRLEQISLSAFALGLLVNLYIGLIVINALLR